jgi:hypothetical protein
MILAAIIWYLIGSVGTMVLLYIDEGEIRLGDFIFLLTLGGFGGLIIFIAYFSINSDISKKKLF